MAQAAGSREYEVTVHTEDDHVWAEVAELPGCFASAPSLDELWDALAEAIGLYLSSDGVKVLIKINEVGPADERVERHRILVS